MSLSKKKIESETKILKNLQEQRKKTIEGSARNKKLFRQITNTKNNIKRLKDERSNELDRIRNEISSLNDRSVNIFKGYKSDVERNGLDWTDVIDLLQPTATHNKAIELSDGTYYTISRSNKKDLLNVLKRGYRQLRGDSTGSDMSIDYELIHVNPRSIVIHNIPKIASMKGKKLRKGGYFKYLHNMSIDLTRYQIYNELNSESNETNCLIHAMIKSGLFDKKKINQAKMLCHTVSIQLKKMKEVATELDIKISIYNGHETYVYNKESENEHLELNLLEDHYFLNDKETNITSYALENYFELKDEDNFNEIVGLKQDNSYQRRKTRNISSWGLVKFLLENKDEYLTEINEDLFVSNKVKEVVIDDLEYVDNCEPIVLKEQKIDYDCDEWNHLYLDFETCTVDENRNNLDKHIPYMVHGKYVKGGSNDAIWDKTFIGENCGLDILNAITKNTVIFAHNIKYDINFIFKHTLNDTTCERGGRFITGQSKFYNKFSGRIYLLKYRDTFHMISKPIKKFPEMFKLGEMKKEIMPYLIYTPESIKQDDYSVVSALDSLYEQPDIKSSDQTDMFNNILKWNLITRPGFFNHMEYSKIYCKQDVNIMYEGYQIFKKWMLNVTGLNIINYSTISSVAYDYGVKSGCFEGCYYITGIPRIFIDRCVVGGRCMTSENKSQHVKGKIQDFDGVSLYPSAMSRMSFLKGKPKVLQTLNYDEIKNYDGYFVEINVNKVNKTRKFPLLSRKDKNGIRQFQNDLLGSHYVDKTSLEDLIRYHDIEFDVIRGYYFDEGRNNSIQHVIRNLFETRKTEKKKGNPIEEVYKLLMNSIYGKTLLKYDPKEIRYIRGEEDYYTYLCRNYYYINNWNKIDGADKYRIQSIKSVDQHFSCPQVGCEILSMSKRIMNEVMCLADDLNINIYYQDTDSMHIDDDSIELLRSEYYKLYNRELIGKDLGQFHSDFEDKFKKNMDKDFEPYSVELIAICKKTYIDKVQIGNNKYGYHKRCKGIPSRCIDDIVRREYEDDNMRLYEDMNNKKRVEFNLLCDNKKMFEFGRNFTVKNRKDFTRSFQIIDDDGNEDCEDEFDEYQY